MFLGECLGYRAMWRRLKTKGIEVPRDVVRLALKEVAPRAVEMRRARRLKRRNYANPGPNFCWHVDGYDKLKPFGFAIHGAIDGFSRKVLWLTVGVTNNNPQVTALHFARTVKQLQTLPCVVRCDRGTENVHIEKCQKIWRRNSGDEFSGMKSFLYGKSTANQRIESWWAMLRRQCTNFWINLFKDMQTIGLLNVTDNAYLQCLRLV